MTDIMGLIKDKGWSVAGLARDLNITRPTLYYIIKRQTTMPRLELACKLAERLDSTLDDLWGGRVQ